jgi:hypothetical protein
MSSLPGPTALVHEWFTPRSVGGAELVVQELDQLLGQLQGPPQLHALVDGESGRPGSWLQGRSIHTSFIQALPWGISHVQQYLPLLPLAIEQLDLGSYPLAVSSSHLVAKGCLTSPDQLHVSYVHTPVRYAWDQMHADLAHSALARRGLGPLIRLNLHQLRQWDLASSQRPDQLVANSRFTAERIRRYWGRSATVVHPPVAVERFRPDQGRDDWYLCLCRLVPYKRVDLVIEAFNRTGLPLLVVGDGPERQRLQALAGPNVTLLGRQDAETGEWPAGPLPRLCVCRARRFRHCPGGSDGGRGTGDRLWRRRLARYGALPELGHRPPHGVLFPEQSAASLVAALEQFHAQKLWGQLPAERQRAWAERFSGAQFRQRFAAVLERAWHDHGRRRDQRSAPWPGTQPDPEPGSLAPLGAGSKPGMARFLEAPVYVPLA